MSSQEICGRVASAAAMLFAATVAASSGASAQNAPWTGFSVGLHVGVADPRTDGRFDLESDAAIFTPMGLRDSVDGGLFDLAGLVGGGHLGYDWSMGRFILGLGVDFTYLGAEDTLFDADPQPENGGAPPTPELTTDDATFELSWIASVRGRVGVVSGRTLLFLSPGVAWADARYTARENDFDPTSRGSVDMSGLGWTLGGGFEHAIGNGFALRFEARYYRFQNTEDASTLNVDSDAGDFARLEDVMMATLGVTYRFNQVDPVVDEPPVDWTGFHIGASGGVTRVAFDSLFDASERSSSRDNDDSVLGRFFDPRGGSISAQMGYTHQIGSWVIGVDAEATWHSNSDRLRDPDPEATTDEAALDVDFTGSVSLRGGYASGRSLFYALGGVGFVDATYRASDLDSPPTATGFLDIETVGAVLGFGFEHRIIDGLSLTIEGRHYFFNDRRDASLLTFDSDEGDFAELDSVTTFQMGLRYRFGGAE